MKEAIVKGAMSDDVRFREAERLGIDIRPKREEDISKATFKLNFFSEDEEVEVTGLDSLRPSAPELKCTLKYDEYAQESSKSIASKLPLKIITGSSAEPPMKPYLFGEVIEKCLLFCRKKCEHFFYIFIDSTLIYFKGLLTKLLKIGERLGRN